MTKIFTSVADWRQFRRTALFTDKTLGLVPTMGNLHDGHKSLLVRSVQDNDMTLLSIFINPTQFNDPNDLTNYPKTIQADIKLAKEASVDFILMPDYQQMYPNNYRYIVTEEIFSKELCGKHRPGHFNGMLTVVLKLLMLAKADRAYFGEKDFQQLQLVKDMVIAFFIDTEIVACPTIRNARGLALSSRNNLLTAEELELAPVFPELLGSAYSIPVIVDKLMESGFAVDYIEERFNRRFGAVRLGRVRLIDNRKKNGY